jgi:peptidylprolyl isomerase
MNRITTICLILLSIILTSCAAACSTGGTKQPDDIKSNPVNGCSVTTRDAGDITINSVSLPGNLSSMGTAESVDVSFEFGTKPGFYLFNTPSQSLETTGSFSASLNGLLSYQTYYYRAKASGETTVYGEEKSFTTQPELSIDTGKTYTATIQTSFGDIVIRLLPEESPIAVDNFVRLSRDGFYDGLTFHRVIDNYIIQGGDPEGNGTGNPGYRFPDEEVTRDYAPGTLAMANSGPNTNGCQFFITLADITQQLPKNYTIFGLVTEGLDVARAIGAVPTTTGLTQEQSKPVSDVNIDTVIIEER